MELTAENKLKKLIVVGDRVLIKPLKESDKTASGILLPPGVRENSNGFHRKSWSWISNPRTFG